MAGKKTDRGTGKSTRSRKKSHTDGKYVSHVVKNEIIGILLVGLACLGLVLMFTGSGGVVGTGVMNVLRLISGDATVIIFLGVAACGFLIMSNTSQPLRIRIMGITLSWVVTAAFVHLALGSMATMESAFQGLGGGVVGGALAFLLEKGVGRNGSYVILVVVGLISLLLIFNRSLVQLIGWVGSKMGRGAGKIGAQLSDFGSEVFGDGSLAKDRDGSGSKERTKGKGQGRHKGGAKGTDEGEGEAVTVTTSPEDKAWPYQYFAGGYGPEGDKDADADSDEVEVFHFNDEEQDTGELPSFVQGEKGAELAPAEAAGKETGAVAAAGDHQSQRTGTDLRAKGPVSAGSRDTRQLVQSTPLSRQSVRGRVYKLPGLNLLHKPLKDKNAHLNKSITDNVKLLEETLGNFGVTVKVVRVTQGPAITRFELQPAPGIKVSRITSLSDDIALALAASNVRIEAPIPGKSVVGIEVPNQEISAVHFREVIDSPEYKNMPSKMTVALGKDISGHTIVADLAKMPHLLIAGATGSGKSVCINSLICSILYKACPDEVKMLLIDPKMVELINYNGAPHLIAPVVVEPQKAAGALKWMVTEMDSRYELFARAGVRDVVRYNFLAAEQEEKAKQKAAQASNLNDIEPDIEPGKNKEAARDGDESEPNEFSTGVLPYVVIVIDELADLMMVAPADVEDAICRLAQMARAAGIHLIVATQRPSVDVITGLIKANIPSRIAFAVSSQIDSRTILDMAGAEKLLGRGDMLYSNMSIAKPIRVQGCFLDDGEVKNIVEFWKHQANPEYLEIPEGNFQVAQNEEPEDELFYKAVQIVIDSGTASVSYLQRRLKIGYTRAARLMDTMEEKGVVGKSEGAKPREILMTRGVFEQRFGQWHEG
ncbi:MAG: DNA translocase FtsK [Peptococcaceae bacterium]|nr:DNA translocase FtsK [Peptococcaceae bacterium]